MLVLFAHLVSLNPEWRDARISIKSIATSRMMLDRNRTLLDRLIRSARIRADTDVMLRPADVSVTNLICAESQEADLVLMGLRDIGPGEEEAYGRRLAQFVDGLPTVLFVRSAGEFRGRLLGEGHDNGTAGDAPPPGSNR